jgi:predicted DNA-binding transcriptional regulator YafY
MNDMPEQRRWSFEQRLEFIELRLFWDGKINRSNIVDHFGISVPQASSDLAAYQALAPDNLHYDKSRKTYVASNKFKPAVTRPTARKYLSQLRAIEDGVLERQETWLPWVPSFATVPLVRRRLDTGRLRAILRAIRHSHAIHVEYQSFSRPRATERWITPHALGFDGFRWHLRAWCHEHDEFRDFVLARLLAVRGSRPERIDPLQDRQWHTMLTMRLAPHPRMKGGQRKAIELDYGMEHGHTEVQTRVCLSYYLERHLGLDLDPDNIPPERQQIVLENRREVEEARRMVSSRAPSMVGYT